MDFATLLWDCVFGLIPICFPPILTIGMISLFFFPSGKTKATIYSNKKVIVIGILFYIVITVITCFTVWFLTKDIYAM